MLCFEPIFARTFERLTPDRYGDPQFCLDGLLHLPGDHPVGTVESSSSGPVRSTKASSMEYSSTSGREAPEYLEHPDGKEAVGLIVRREDDGIGTDLLHLEEPHPPRDPPGLCLVACGRHDPALLAGDDGFTPELWMDRLLAGGKEGIGIQMEDRLRPGMDGEGLGGH